MAERAEKTTPPTEQELIVMRSAINDVLRRADVSRVVQDDPEQMDLRSGDIQICGSKCA